MLNFYSSTSNSERAALCYKVFCQFLIRTVTVLHWRRLWVAVEVWTSNFCMVTLFESGQLRDKWLLLIRYLSPSHSTRFFLNQAGTWLRWLSSQHTGRSLMQGGDPGSSLSCPGPPGGECGCWSFGWPLRQRTLRCWRFYVDPWDAFGCLPPHVGHTHGCALCVFCLAFQWPPRCTCHQRRVSNIN